MTISSEVKLEQIVRACRDLAPTKANGQATGAWKYLDSRGLNPSSMPPDVKCQPHAIGKHGAVVVLVRNDAGDVVAAHRIFIAPDGRKAKPDQYVGEKSKRSYGSLKGNPFVFPGEGMPIVCEGFETAASVWQSLDCKRKVLCTFGINMLGSIPLPPRPQSGGNSTIQVIADADNEGSEGWNDLIVGIYRLQQRGCCIQVSTPDGANGRDANDVLMEEGEEGVRELVHSWTLTNSEAIAKTARALGHSSSIDRGRDEQTADDDGSPIVSAGDHMERARDFVSAVRPHMRHYREDVVDYERGRYARVADSTLKSDAYKWLDKCKTWKANPQTGKSKLVRFQPASKSVTETVNALKAERHLLPDLEQPCWLDGRAGPDPSDLVSFPNGILDLCSGKLLQPDPMLFTPYAVGFDYDPNANEPKEWKTFLDQIYDGEHDQIDALQEMFGYCLSSDVSQEKSFIWLGPKRGGKDTSKNMLCRLLPPGAVCGPTLDSMATNFGMSAFIHKQLAIVGDMRLGSKADKDLLAENVLKLTGRGLFTIDRKHQSHWTGKLPCKLLLISNEMPRIKDTSGALASRQIIFNTRVSFYGKEDPNLFRDKLAREAPGVLLWALDGLRRMRERGSLAEPDSSKEARLQLARDGSPVLAFVDECIALVPDAEMPKDEMLDVYLDYAAANNLRPMDKPVFMSALVAATGGKVRAAKAAPVDGKRTPIVQGARVVNRPRKRHAEIPF